MVVAGAAAYEANGAAAETIVAVGAARYEANGAAAYEANGAAAETKVEAGAARYVANGAARYVANGAAATAGARLINDKAATSPTNLTGFGKLSAAKTAPTGLTP